MDDRDRFRFVYPVEVRYGDVDAQGHVNHTKFLTYMEMARFKYMQQLGLFKPGMPYENAGMIVADAQCSYRVPLEFPEIALVHVRVAAVGNRSFTLHYRLERASDGRLVALGRTVQVAYDYARQTSQPVPDSWRAQFAAFEGEAGDGGER